MSDIDNSEISLVDEFASEAQLRAMGRINKIRNAKLNGEETEMLLFNELGAMIGITPMRVANDIYCDASVGEDAMMTRMQLRGQQAKNGIPGNPGEEMQRPSFFARNNPFNKEAREEEREYQQYKKEVKG